MLHTPTRRQLGFEFLAQTRTQERLVGSYARALEQVGIAMRLRTLDSSQYAQRVKAFDFDMVQANWLSSLSPGNEQLNRWGSRAADTPNSFNYAGIREPAVDAIISELLAARTQADFVSSVRALDRVLISGDYVIPLFHLPRVWIAHKYELKSPATLPLAGIDVDSWWIEPVR
jgi:peptide/nickel transport system substrate-binding protein